jgi:DNA integrity scanning protein DisA with diadenylate cyclase activity
MIEAFIPALVAVSTGVAVLFNKVNHRVTVLDQRVDKLELKLVESFTTKVDFASAMERMEQHLIRIEDKMDKLVDKKCTT